jgi:hypothetical protein
MPVRFTCRLLIVPTAGDKYRVQYGPLDDPQGRLLTVHSPEVVIPPTGEMTHDEVEQWEFKLVSKPGFYGSMENTSVDAPLVEAKRTVEDEIPPGSVRTELFWARNNRGDRTLAVRVTNGWDRPIPRFSLATVADYEAPQPWDIRGIDAQMLGGSETFFHPMGPVVGPDFWPGRTAEFALDTRVLPSVRSRAAALSPESHRISLRTDGYEFDRIGGGRVAEFLMTEEDEGNGQPDLPTH